MTDLINRADAIDACCRGWNNTAEDCIRNIKALPSTKLPKGDLISRADAIEAVCNGCHWWSGQCDNDKAFRCDEVCRIEALPSADAVEVDRTSEWVAVRREEYEDYLAKSADAVHGEWIMHGEPPWLVRECSECGTKWHQWSGDSNPNYCGHCGARMKGGDDE